ncbi:hypothetical protein SSAG_03820 [Streptomyces sp. Mg1]|nr:hypothetical protein SSAG_03820 [Streptomyces sp. Mg1]
MVKTNPHPFAGQIGHTYQAVHRMFSLSLKACSQGLPGGNHGVDRC